MEYIVVRASEGHLELIKEVNKLIQKWWQPQWWLCIASYDYGVAWFYYQAMIKINN